MHAMAMIHTITISLQDACHAMTMITISLQDACHDYAYETILLHDACHDYDMHGCRKDCASHVVYSAWHTWLQERLWREAQEESGAARKAEEERQRVAEVYSTV